MIKSVTTPLAKSLLIPLGLIAAASAADAGIHILGSGNNTTLVISNKDMDDLIKKVKSLEESGLLLKRNHWMSSKWNKRTKRRIS